VRSESCGLCYSTDPYSQAVACSVSYDLAGKTAVVTVGAKGIGKAISECLAKSGAPVWVWDMSPVENVGSVVVGTDLKVL
jgi:S-adenosylhomocysteine hydrolase